MIKQTEIALLTLNIRNTEDVIKARQRTRHISALLEFSHIDQTRITAAVSEITRNAYLYAGGGKVEYFLIQSSINKEASLGVRVSDKGPGISELALVLSKQARNATAGTAKGISGAQQIMDRFAITSEVSKGTIVWMEMQLPLEAPFPTAQRVAYILGELARHRFTDTADEMLQQNRELIHALNLLNKAHDELEMRVHERTIQLSTKNQELLQEINERVNTQQALQTVTQQLHVALKAARMGTWQLDGQTREVIFDQYLARLLGLAYEDKRLSLAEMLSLVAPQERTRIEWEIEQACQKGITLDTEFQVIWPDGSIRTLASRGEVYLNKLGKASHLVSICWDVTERKQAEALLHQHQQELARLTRMNAMGEIGSSLAHELSQPLTAITTFTQGCIRRLADNNYQASTLLEAMKVVAQQAERAGSIIHHLKDLVRKGKIMEERVNINDIVHHATYSLNYETYLIKTTSIEFDLTENLPCVKVDKIQIEQVLINLIRNALEAMHEAHISKPRVQLVTALHEDNFIVVSVRDNGPAFPSEVASKLMEPYFTTKPEGMGLGLSISRTIIEAHGGKLTASAGAAEGTCFQFTLPILKGEHNEEE